MFGGSGGVDASGKTGEVVPPEEPALGSHPAFTPPDPQACSAEAHQAIKACGWISKTQQVAYAILSDLGPATAREVGDALTGSQDRDITPRLSELAKTGAVERIGKRVCMVTGRTATLWGVTNRAPVKPEAQEKAREMDAFSDGAGVMLLALQNSGVHISDLAASAAWARIEDGQVTR